LTDAEFVKDARSKLGMTQIEFADQLGVTDRAVSAWEAGATPLTKSRRSHIELLLRQQRKR
jgi:DNA-binding transcriptional regulator YiaG